MLGSHLSINTYLSCCTIWLTLMKEDSVLLKLVASDDITSILVCLLWYCKDKQYSFWSYTTLITCIQIHTSPLNQGLFWLSICFQFNMLMMIFKVLKSLSPEYLILAFLHTCLPTIQYWTFFYNPVVKSRPIVSFSWLYLKYTKDYLRRHLLYRKYLILTSASANFLLPILYF